jgi:ribosomal protein S27AE
MRRRYQAQTVKQRRAERESRDVERVRSEDRARHAARKGKDSDYDKRIKAVWTLNNAVRDGKVERGLCEGCGTTVNVQGHHDNYDEPLKVRWLCTTCHATHHAAVV